MIGRTEIAAMALQGLLGHPGPTWEKPLVTRLAVEYADALLAELSKVPPPAGVPDLGKEALPLESSAGAAGDTEGAASPHAEANTEPGQRAPATESAPPLGKDVATAGNPASPVYVFDCEVDRYDGDGPCAGPILYDPFSHGRFCEPHMTAAPSGRAEWHRRNKDRNAPAAEAVG